MLLGCYIAIAAVASVVSGEIETSVFVSVDKGITSSRKVDTEYFQTKEIYTQSLRYLSLIESTPTVHSESAVLHAAASPSANFILDDKTLNVSQNLMLKRSGEIEDKNRLIKKMSSTSHDKINSLKDNTTKLANQTMVLSISKTGITETKHFAPDIVSDFAKLLPSITEDFKNQDGNIAQVLPKFPVDEFTSEQLKSKSLDHDDTLKYKQKPHMWDDIALLPSFEIAPTHANENVKTATLPQMIMEAISTSDLKNKLVRTVETPYLQDNSSRSDYSKIKFNTTHFSSSKSLMVPEMFEEYTLKDMIYYANAKSSIQDVNTFLTGSAQHREDMEKAKILSTEKGTLSITTTVKIKTDMKRILTTPNDLISSFLLVEGSDVALSVQTSISEIELMPESAEIVPATISTFASSLTASLMTPADTTSIVPTLITGAQSAGSFVPIALLYMSQLSSESAKSASFVIGRLQNTSVSTGLVTRTLLAANEPTPLPLSLTRNIKPSLIINKETTVCCEIGTFAPPKTEILFHKILNISLSEPEITSITAGFVNTEIECTLECITTEGLSTITPIYMPTLKVTSEPVTDSVYTLETGSSLINVNSVLSANAAAISQSSSKSATDSTFTSQLITPLGDRHYSFAFTRDFTETISSAKIIATEALSLVRLKSIFSSTFSPDSLFIYPKSIETSVISSKSPVSFVSTQDSITPLDITPDRTMLPDTFLAILGTSSIIQAPTASFEEAIERATIFVRKSEPIKISEAAAPSQFALKIGVMSVVLEQLMGSSANTQKTTESTSVTSKSVSKTTSPFITSKNKSISLTEPKVESSFIPEVLMSEAALLSLLASTSDLTPSLNITSPSIITAKSESLVVTVTPAKVSVITQMSTLIAVQYEPSASSYKTSAQAADLFKLPDTESTVIILPEVSSVFILLKSSSILIPEPKATVISISEEAESAFPFQFLSFSSSKQEVMETSMISAESRILSATLIKPKPLGVITGPASPFVNITGSKEPIWTLMNMSEPKALTVKPCKQIASFSITQNLEKSTIRLEPAVSFVKNSETAITPFIMPERTSTTASIPQHEAATIDSPELASLANITSKPRTKFATTQYQASSVYTLESTVLSDIKQNLNTKFVSISEEIPFSGNTAVSCSSKIEPITPYLISSAIIRTNLISSKSIIITEPTITSEVAPETMLSPTISSKVPVYLPEQDLSDTITMKSIISPYINDSEPIGLPGTMTESSVVCAITQGTTKLPVISELKALSGVVPNLTSHVITQTASTRRLTGSPAIQTESTTLSFIMLNLRSLPQITKPSESCTITNKPITPFVKQSVIQPFVTLNQISHYVDLTDSAAKTDNTSETIAKFVDTLETVLPFVNVAASTPPAVITEEPITYSISSLASVAISGITSDSMVPYIISADSTSSGFMSKATMVFDITAELATLSINSPKQQTSLDIKPAPTIPAAIMQEITASSDSLPGSTIIFTIKEEKSSADNTPKYMVPSAVMPGPSVTSSEQVPSTVITPEQILSTKTSPGSISAPFIESESINITKESKSQSVSATKSLESVVSLSKLINASIISAAYTEKTERNMSTIALIPIKATTKKLIKPAVILPQTTKLMAKNPDPESSINFLSEGKFLSPLNATESKISTIITHVPASTATSPSVVSEPARTLVIKPEREVFISSPDSSEPSVTILQSAIISLAKILSSDNSIEKNATALETTMSSFMTSKLGLSNIISGPITHSITPKQSMTYYFFSLNPAISDDIKSERETPYGIKIESVTLSDFISKIKPTNLTQETKTSYTIALHPTPTAEFSVFQDDTELPVKITEVTTSAESVEFPATKLLSNALGDILLNTLGDITSEPEAVFFPSTMLELTSALINQKTLGVITLQWTNTPHITLESTSSEVIIGLKSDVLEKDPASGFESTKKIALALASTEWISSAFITLSSILPRVIASSAITTKPVKLSFFTPEKLTTSVNTQDITVTTSEAPSLNISEKPASFFIPVTPTLASATSQETTALSKILLEALSVVTTKQEIEVSHIFPYPMTSSPDSKVSTDTTGSSAESTPEQTGTSVMIQEPSSPYILSKIATPELTESSIFIPTLMTPSAIIQDTIDTSGLPLQTTPFLYDIPEWKPTSLIKTPPLTASATTQEPILLYINTSDSKISQDVISRSKSSIAITSELISSDTTSFITALATTKLLQTKPKANISNAHPDTTDALLSTEEYISTSGTDLVNKALKGPQIRPTTMSFKYETATYMQHDERQTAFEFLHSLFLTGPNQFGSRTPVEPVASLVQTTLQPSDYAKTLESSTISSAGPIALSVSLKTTYFHSNKLSIAVSSSTELWRGSHHVSTIADMQSITDVSLLTSPSLDPSTTTIEYVHLYCGVNNLLSVGIKVKGNVDIKTEIFKNVIIQGLQVCFIEGITYTEKNKRSRRAPRKIMKGQHRYKRSFDVEVKILSMERLYGEPVKVDIVFCVTHDNLPLLSSQSVEIYNQLSDVEISATLTYPIYRPVSRMVVLRKTTTTPPEEPSPALVVIVVVPIATVSIAIIIISLIYCCYRLRISDDNEIFVWKKDRFLSFRKPTIEELDMKVDVERGEIVNNFSECYSMSVPPHKWNLTQDTDMHDTDIKATANNSGKMKFSRDQGKPQSDANFNINLNRLKALGFRFKDDKKCEIEIKHSSRVSDKACNHENDRLYETLNGKHENEKHNNDLRRDSQTIVMPKELKQRQHSVDAKVRLIKKQTANVSDNENPPLAAEKTNFFLIQNMSFQNSKRISSSQDDFEETSVSVMDTESIMSNSTDYENDTTVLSDTLEDDVFDGLLDDTGRSSYLKVHYENTVNTSDKLVDKDEYRSTSPPRYGHICNSSRSDDEKFNFVNELNQSNILKDKNKSCYRYSVTSNKNNKNKFRNYPKYESVCNDLTNEYGKSVCERKQLQCSPKRPTLNNSRVYEKGQGRLTARDNDDVKGSRDRRTRSEQQ